MDCCKDQKQVKQSSDQEVCPVMKNPVDPKIAKERGAVREYEEKTYYFCCEGCPEKFDQNPKQYVGVSIGMGGGCC